MTATVPATDKGDVVARIARLASEIVGVRIDEISESSTLESDLKMESVTFVELQVAIEEEFGIEIDPIEVVELNEFGKICEYVHRLVMNSVT
jgi:acyl carrier protein